MKQGESLDKIQEETISNIENLNQNQKKQIIPA